MDNQDTGLDQFEKHFGPGRAAVQFTSARHSQVQIHFGEGSQETSIFDVVDAPQFSLIHLFLDLKREQIISDNGRREEISSVFMLEGQINSRFERIGGNVSPAGNHHNFLYTPDCGGEHFFRKGRTKVINLNFNPDFVKSVLAAEEQKYARVFGCITSQKPFLLSSTNLPLQTQMLHIIHQISHCPYSGATRSMYLEAKGLELFTLQLEQLDESFTGSESNHLVQSDALKLKETRAYIEEHFLEPLSLHKLALLFGLNDFKLKKGYKLMFGKTVFGHIQELKMEKAWHLLFQKHMNVTEVSDFVGYSSVSHFSVAFRKMFGMPPSAIQK